MGEWSHNCCDVGNCQYLLFLSAGFLIISFGYFFAKECRSRYFSSASCVVVEELFTSEACDFGDM